MKRIRYLNFWLFVVALVGGTIVFAPKLGVPRGILAGFDIGALIFIAGTLHLMRGAAAESMRTRARDNDPDHHILIVVALLLVAVVLVALTVELTGAGGGERNSVALAGITLLLAWLFSNLVFALHYAHSFYSPAECGDEQSRGDGTYADSGGLQFPGDEMPLYGDFAYFAFVLGMTFQVSDVQITSRSVRRLALYHALIAFMFNIVVVALSVSLIGNLLQK